MKLLGEHNIEGLTPAHRVAFLNTKKRRIKDYSIQDPEVEDMELFQSCTNILGTCYELFGQPAPGDDQEEKNKNLYVTTQLLYGELTKYFTTYSVDEVMEAVKMGFCGNLGPLDQLSFPMVSVVNISKLVHLYNEKVRRPAVEAQGKIQAADRERIEKEKTEEKNRKSREITTQNINRVFAYFLETDEIPTVNGIEITVYELSMWYKFLDERGLSGISKDEKKQIAALADDRVPKFGNLTAGEKAGLQDPARRKEWEEQRLYLIGEFSRAIALKHVFINAKKESKTKMLE